MKPAIQLRPLDDALFSRYADFAARAFGAGSYQTDPRYLRWLRANPRARPADAIVALTGEEVIGCIFKMPLEWRVAGEPVAIPALHNWFVAPEHRSGVGGMLLSAAFSGEQHAFIPIAAGELATIYRTLKCEEVVPSWYRKILAPVRGALRLGVDRLRKTRPPPSYRYPSIARAVAALPDGIVAAFDPAPGSQAEMAELARAVAGSASGPSWGDAFFRWRFFSPDGPRHLALTLRQGGALAGFALVSVGEYRHVAVGRLVELVARDEAIDARLLRAAEIALARLDADLLIYYCLDGTRQARLRRAGWRPTSQREPAFFFHRKRGSTLAPFGFGASAADFGLESILS